MNYKVLILTSGTGSRMGELTKSTNKALLPVGGRLAIDYVLDKYDPSIEIVITLGYLGAQVRKSLTERYPDRKFSFAPVDRFEGAGSSQNYSTWCAREFLQIPFVFHSCDTIVTDSIPPPDHNWVAGHRLPGDMSQYRTHQIENGQLVKILDKGEPGFETIHIGLVGIHDFDSFWKNLDRLRRERPDDQTLNDTTVINAMLESGQHFELKRFSSWYDTGNLSAMALTQAALTHHR